MILEKHKIKRCYAHISFASILCILATALWIAAYGDEGAADRLQAVSAIIIAVLFFLTSIVGAYMGITHHDDLQERKYAQHD